MKEHGTAHNGITLRSVGASIAVMLLTALLIQFVGVTDGWRILFGSEALAVPVLAIMTAVIVAGGAVYAAARFRLLTRAELYVVFFSSLVAAPLMNYGLWRYFIAFGASIPRNADFEKYDALGSRLWPHGPNILADSFRQGAWHAGSNGAVFVRTVTLTNGTRVSVLALTNGVPESVCTARIILPVSDGPLAIVLGQPYIATVLARGRRLHGDAQYWWRVYYDDAGEFGEEVFSSREGTKRTKMQPDGYTRYGRYGVAFPLTLERHAVLELALSGAGDVEFRDIELMNVSALEYAFTGRQIISRDEYDRLPPAQRAGLVVRPRRLLSVEGVKFLVAGYIPYRDWLPPAGVYGGFVVLVLTALFSLAVIMRRQWMQSERYGMPVARVPLAMIGDERDARHAFALLWRNRLMWAGCAVAFAWCLLKGGREYLPMLPDINVGFAVKTYLADALWGNTWDGVNFGISLFVLGFALFMDISVLMSLVAGFILFRLQYLVGESFGWSADKSYPYPTNQAIGAVFAYAALTLVFTRRYLAAVLVEAVHGDREAGEVMTRRGALLLLVACGLGMAAWSRWAGLPAQAMLGFFACVVLAGLVAAKLRAECGFPAVNIFSLNFLLLVPYLGGIRAFGPEAIMFLVFAQTILGGHAFMQLPGLQLELIECGTRTQVKPRHTGLTWVLGIAGGVLIGGWIYLASANAIGAENYPITTGEFLRIGDFKILTSQVAAGEAGTALVRGRLGPDSWAIAFGAGCTTLIVLMRQWLAGFWFHPIGFILGSTNAIKDIWGSLLVACALRFAVLKLGGAAAVRNRLLPFAAGLILGVTAGYLFFAVLNGYFFFFSPRTIQFKIGF
ncbi:hypothetical protein GX586_13205 [bacterium]|nr:hypothetical protein [bacterium]